MRDENKMKENGKVQQHRERNKAAKRKRDKLESRLIQLERDEFFTREEKKSVKRAFSVETMSPEVSDDEDATRRVAIPFIWESSKMTDIKRVLDADYRQSLVAQSRRQQSVQIYNRRRENTASEGHPELGHLVHVRHGVMRLE
uniref:Uncharacterized protein n=1 Tax=Magallana gigas TaxID=29159 RepID=K1RDN0_MAGGI